MINKKKLIMVHIEISRYVHPVITGNRRILPTFLIVEIIEVDSILEKKEPMWLIVEKKTK